MRLSNEPRTPSVPPRRTEGAEFGPAGGSVCGSAALAGPAHPLHIMAAGLDAAASGDTVDLRGPHHPAHRAMLDRGMDGRGGVGGVVGTVAMVAARMTVRPTVMTGIGVLLPVTAMMTRPVPMARAAIVGMIARTGMMFAARRGRGPCRADWH